MTQHPYAGDPSFDRYARMVRRALGVPLAMVSLVEADRQVFPGASGLPEELQVSRQTPISHSICQYVVADDQALIVPDTSVDLRLEAHPAVLDLGVAAYAGWPITDETGRTIGSLCALDYEVHHWSRADVDALQDLAASCSAELAQRGLSRSAEESRRLAEHLTTRSQVLLSLSENLAGATSLAEIATAVETVAVVELDCLRAGLWLDARLGSASQSVGLYATPEQLTFVPNVEHTWASATAHRAVLIDAGHPISESALNRVSLFFDNRVEQDARYPGVPATAEAGESRAFLPLHAGRQLLGTLVLTWEAAREFEPEDRATFAALASYTAQAIARVSLVEGRLTASRTLQAAMLSELPQPDHLEIAARYRTASRLEQVGGDWYDAVILPSGCTALTIGDVVGHDIAAAAHMGQLRNLLRGMAWTTDDLPSRTVASLDKGLAGLGINAIASLVFARIEQTDSDRRVGLRTLRWTNAGHPPPVLVDRDGDVRQLEGNDLLLGVDPQQERGDLTESITPDSTLLLYTDGLVERRGETIDDGLSRLRDSVARHRSLGLDAMLDALLNDLAGAELADDVALLGVRFHDEDGPPPT